MSQPDLARGLSAGAVREQLARMLRSRTFSNAPALGRLLRYVVEATLEQRADSRQKEYTIGVEVFDRGASFDPKTDTIVRVQARRLRSKLQQYYRTDGQFDPIRIEMPTGRYAAVFSPLTLSLVSSTVQDGTGTLQAGRSLRAVPSAPPRARQTLPAPRTPLIGREHELEAITGLLLDDQVRLVTLTGTGGSGKTRLALGSAEQVRSAFDGGVFMLALASLTESGAVASALAQLLGLRFTGGRPLREALRAHANQTLMTPTLLLLDNFEHVIDASPVITDLLDASPHVKVLVTSRAGLRLYGEHEYPVPPLAVPHGSPDLEALEQNPAVQLFVQRARSVEHTFRLTASNAAATAALCRRLDGLPLAIELAASRTKLFPVDAMLSRVEHALDFLTTGPSDAPARQRTLRNTIDWSHALLTAPEQRLFHRLAVFVGGFTLEGAEAVCDAFRDLGVAVVEGITSLLGKSLIHQIEPVGAEARFNMLETLREYALERLVADKDDTRTRRAHAAYSIVLAEEGAAASRSAAEWDAWVRRCDIESENFRSCLDWLIARGERRLALRLALALFAYWERRELLDEARQKLDGIVRLPSDAGPSPGSPRALAYLATILNSQGDFAAGRVLHQQALDEFIVCNDKMGQAGQLNALGANCRFMGDNLAARSYWERAVALCRELGDPLATAATLSNVALTMDEPADATPARALLEEARDTFERAGDPAGVLWSLDHLGDVARQAGDNTEARRLYQAALDGFLRLGDVWGIARASSDLADITSELGEHDTARELFARALDVFTRIDHKRGIARVLEGCAVMAVRQRQLDRALTLAGAAAAVRWACGAAPRTWEQARLDISLAAAWRSSHAAGAQAMWERGRRMSLDEAIRFAVS